MAWTLFSVPAPRKGEVEAALRDDLVSRQSQTVRDAATAGGPSGALYVLVEGSTEGVKKAEEVLAPLGTRLPPAEAEPIFRRFQEEREAASSGMGLFFTEE